MVHIDFKEKRKELHDDIINAIISLMLKGERQTIVFGDAVENLPKVIRFLDVIGEYEVVRVKAIKYDGCNLFYKSYVSEDKSNELEENWWSLRYETAQAYIIQLYEKVFNFIASEK